MHYSGEPVEVSTSQVEEQNLKDFDMKLTTCRTEAKLYMCINGQWVWEEMYILYVVKMIRFLCCFIIYLLNKRKNINIYKLLC